MMRLRSSIFRTSPSPAIDDWEVVGPPGQAFEAFDRLKAAHDEEGLQTNLPKCAVTWTHPGEVLEEVIRKALRGIPITVGASKVVGGIIGRAQDKVDEFLNQHIADQQNLHSALKHDRFPLQLVPHILRVVPASRSNYIARTTDPRLICPHLEALDQLVTDTLQHCVGAVNPLPDEALKQAQLPIGRGGLGIRAMQLFAPGAFLAGQSLAMPVTGPMRSRYMLANGNIDDTEYGRGISEAQLLVISRGVQIDRFMPADSSALWSTFSVRCPPKLQPVWTLQAEKVTVDYSTDTPLNIELFAVLLSPTPADGSPPCQRNTRRRLATRYSALQSVTSSAVHCLRLSSACVVSSLHTTTTSTAVLVFGLRRSPAAMMAWSRASDASF